MNNANPKPGCRMPERRPGENDKVFFGRMAAWISGDDVRTTTDLRDWTGSLPFHLNREASDSEQHRVTDSRTQRFVTGNRLGTGVE